MQAFLCDICRSALDGDAYEWQSRGGYIVRTEEGPPRMRQNRNLTMRLICNQCNHWISLAFARLVEAHQTVPN